MKESMMNVINWVKENIYLVNSLILLLMFVIVNIRIYTLQDKVNKIYRSVWSDRIKEIDSKRMKQGLTIMSWCKQENKNCDFATDEGSCIHDLGCDTSIEWLKKYDSEKHMTLFDRVMHQY